MLLDYSKRDRKPEACSLANLLGCKERIKYFAQMFFFHSIAGVGHADLDPLPLDVVSGLDVYNAILTNGIGCVVEQVQPDLLELLLMGVVSRNPRNFRHPNSSPASYDRIQIEDLAIALEGVACPVQQDVPSGRWRDIWVIRAKKGSVHEMDKIVRLASNCQFEVLEIVL